MIGDDPCMRNTTKLPEIVRFPLPPRLISGKAMARLHGQLFRVDVLLAKLEQLGVAKFEAPTCFCCLCYLRLHCLCCVRLSSLMPSLLHAAWAILNLHRVHSLLCCFFMFLYYVVTWLAPFFFDHWCGSQPTHRGDRCLFPLLVNASSAPRPAATNLRPQRQGELGGEFWQETSGNKENDSRKLLWLLHFLSTGAPEIKCPQLDQSFQSWLQLLVSQVRMTLARPGS